MPGLSQYRFEGMSPNPRDAADPRSPAFANNTLSDQDNQNLDAMLRNIDSGAAAPSNMGESRAILPQPANQNNPWLQWLMQYLQSKQQRQGQPR